MKSSLILVSLVFFLRTGSAQSWIQTSAPTNMGDSTFIASSADGRRLIAAGSNPSYFPPVAGPVYTSDDWGNSWTSNHIPPAVWSSAVSSADGGRMMLGTSGGYVFSTTNYGDTWSSNQLQATGQSVNLALSADGNRVAAIVNCGQLFLSTNGGNSWTATNLPPASDCWLSLGASADGYRLAAATQSGVWVSTNAGTDWVSNSLPDNFGCSVAFTPDGRRLLVMGRKFWTSTDMGTTWRTNNSPGLPWAALACSADGTTLIADYASRKWIYISTNSGEDWFSNSVPVSSWSSAALSADGSKWAAGSRLRGGIWTLQMSPHPQMNASPLNSNLELSWICPSTNFVLQQSLDLRNWAGVTNPIILNPANLRDEVILPSAGGAEFFRLTTR